MRRNLFIFALLFLTVFQIFDTFAAEEKKLIPITVGDIERYKNYAPKERALFIKEYYIKNKANGIEDEAILNETLKLVQIDKEAAQEIKERYHKIATYYDNLIKAIHDKVDEINTSILEENPGRTDMLIDINDMKTWDNIKNARIGNHRIADIIKVFNNNAYFSERVVTPELSAELASCANKGESINMSFLMFLRDEIFLKRFEDGGVPDGLQVDFSGSENVAISPLMFPMETMKMINGTKVFGYREKIYLPFTVDLQDKGKEGTVRAVITADVCTKDGCRKETLDPITYTTEKSFLDSSFCQNIKNEYNRMPESGTAKPELKNIAFQKSEDGDVDLIISLKLPAFEENGMNFLIKNEQGLRFSSPFLIEDRKNLIIKAKVLNPEQLKETADIILDVSYPHSGKRFNVKASFDDRMTGKTLSFLSFSLLDLFKSFFLGLQMFIFTPVLTAYLILLYQSAVSREKRYYKSVEMYDGIVRAFMLCGVLLIAGFGCRAFFPAFVWGRQFDSPLLNFVFIMIFMLFALNWKKVFDDVAVELAARRIPFLFSILKCDETKEKAGVFIGLTTGALLLITPTTSLYYDAYNTMIRSVILNSLAFVIGLSAPFFILSLCAEDLDRWDESDAAVFVMDKVVPLTLWVQILILLCSIGVAAGKDVLIEVSALLALCSLLVYKQTRFLNKIVLVSFLIGAAFVPFKSVENTMTEFKSVPFDEALIHRQVENGKGVYLNVSEDFCFLCAWNRFVVRYQGMPEQVENGDLTIMRIKSDDPFLKRILSESPYSSLPMNIVFSPDYPEGKVVDSVFGLWSAEEILNQVYPQQINVVGPSLEKLLEEKKPKRSVKDTN